MDEPLVWVETHPIQWREPRINLAELAKLRWIEGWTRKELGLRYKKTDGAIQNYIQALRRIDFKADGLTEKERRLIKRVSVL